MAPRLLDEIASGATVDRHAADQILPFAALADGPSTRRVPFVTEHTETGAWMAALFLGAECDIDATTVVIRGFRAWWSTR